MENQDYILKLINGKLCIVPVSNSKTKNPEDLILSKDKRNKIKNGN